MFKVKTPLGVVRVAMLQGGNGILRIEKTGEEGELTDVYTVYFTNGTTFEYRVTNGNGSPSDTDDVEYILS